MNQTKSAFDEHQMIEVFYEDLIQDRIETMNRIFDFLNVSRIQVKTTMKKQNPE
ncbi:sulfotransferase [Saccharicrinis aurantiacus]|uniref:sulfotransferase n=1 Tax=Saccharicrinis aurantiacus TaxID=1849719 RepID=UPI003CD0C672